MSKPIGQAGLQPVHPHHQIRPRCARHRVFQKRHGGFARMSFAVQCDRIFKIDDQGIGAARHRLVELAHAVGRNEQKRTHRVTMSLRPHAHEGLAAALGDELVVLVIGAVMKLNDAGAGPRFRFALADHLGRAMHGVAFE